MCTSVYMYIYIYFEFKRHVHVKINGVLWPLEAEAKLALAQKWKNDPDVVLNGDGTIRHFVGPKGRIEDLATHEKRLLHNSRMRFNRSVQGDTHYELGIHNPAAYDYIENPFPAMSFLTSIRI